MFALRPYQQDSITALYTYWGNMGERALIVLPTGAGKSLVIAKLCQEILASYPTMRIAIVTHVRELIAQNYQELMRLWPNAPAGIFSAGIGRRDTHTQILFCGIQSVYNKTDRLGAFDLVLIDECHLISRHAESMYGKFLEGVITATPDMRLVGLTATAFRLDSGRLDYGQGRLFDKVVYEAKVTDLIEQGYLCNLVSKATLTEFDVSGVQKRGGEFIPGQLEAAVDKEWVTKAAAQELAILGRERKSWLAFCTGIAHAEHMRDALKENGIVCETVNGEMSKVDRDRIIGAFRMGKTRCLTSVGVLGTGFNVPQVDLIALLRPTQSAGLFVQQVGRGLRMANGKENCLVLDFAGNTMRHGPIDTITGSSVQEKLDRKKEAALAKRCPACDSLLALACTCCTYCGYEFPRDMTPKHEATADATTTIISKGKEKWVDVDDVKYYRHEKIGSQNSLRVEYQCGFTVHKEWVCLQHTGQAQWRAAQWWKRMAGTPIPRTVEEALERVDEIDPPKQVCVQPDGRYFRIVGTRHEVPDEVA